MDTGKHFIIVRDLATSKSENGDLVTEEFDISQLKKTLGENISVIKYEIRLDNSKASILFVCRKIVKQERKPPSSPLIPTYNN
jgi:hypothetical protein